MRGPTTSIVEFARSSAPAYDLARLALRLSGTSQPLAAQSALTAQIALEEFSKLKGDWDGYGALPLTPESCAHVQKFIAVAPQGMQAPEIAPTSNGTIALEWQSEQGEAFLEVGRTRYSGHIQPHNGGTIFVQGQLSAPIEENFATEQVLAVIKQLLYAASRSDSFENSIQVLEPTF